MKKSLLITACAALTGPFSGSLLAQTYTWTNPAGGSWGTTANWGSAPVFGSDVLLDFSTLNITATATTTLDGARTAGSLKFGDATTVSNDWVVNTGSSGTLTLATTTGTPAIQVVNRTATINAVLAGTQGFEKTGAGTLLLGNNSNTFTGGVAVNEGTLQLGNPTAAATHAFSGTALSVASGATLSMAGSSGSTVTHTYNFGGQLGSTSDTDTANALQLNGGTLAFSSTNATTKAFNARIHATGSSTIGYTASSFTHNLNLNRAITGTGTLTFNWSGGGTRVVNIANLSTTGTGHNFTGSVVLNSAPATTNFNLGQSLGASGYEIRNGWRLNNNVSGGVNSATAITLVDAGSILSLGANSWSNAAATLTANNGTIELGTGASSVGTFVLNSTGTVTLNAGAGGSLSVGTALDIRQGTLAGTSGLTSSVTLNKTTSGTAIINTNNALSGTTTITAGILQVGTGGTTGTIGTGNIANDGTLILNRSDAQSWNQQISGTGSFTIQGGTALTLTNTHSYTGTTTINGSSLTLSGTGGNRLATGSGLAFAGTSSLALGSNDQTVASLSLPVPNADSSTTITGTGTLTINGASPFNFGVSGTGISAVRTAAMDMTGLAGFTFNSPTQLFRVGAQPGVNTTGSGRPDSSFLSSNNTSITASSFLLGDQAGTGTGGNNAFRLGESTVINSNSINIGAGGRSNATLNFNTGLTAPTVTIRGTDGTSRVNQWDIGRVANFTTTTWTAVVDLSGGEVDALVNNLRVGVINTANQLNRQGTQNSTFTMGEGKLDVTTLILGEQSGTFANNTAGGTYAANGTFNLNHDNGLLVAGSIRLAENTGSLTGGTRSVSGTLNLQAGTIEAGEIRLGDQTASSPASVTRAFNFTSGTLRNRIGQDLSIIDLPVNLTGSGSRFFEATSGQSINLAASAAISGGGGFTKSGAGNMAVDSISTHSGATTVAAGVLAINGAFTNSNVSVQNGAILQGSGSVANGVSVASGATLAPGNSIESLSIGSLNLQAGSIFDYEMEDNSATGADFVVVTVLDGLTLGGATLNLTGADFGNWALNDKLTLLAYRGGAITSGFNGFVDDSVYTFGSNQWRIDYDDTTAGSNYAGEVGSSDRFVTLTVVPEPSSALLVLGATGCLLRRRRRV